MIELNAEEEWCDIEGAATFETFVAETAKEGFMPLVVPELKTITVGGTIVGIGAHLQGPFEILNGNLPRGI